MHSCGGGGGEGGEDLVGEGREERIWQHSREEQHYTCSKYRKWSLCKGNGYRVLPKTEQYTLKHGTLLKPWPALVCAIDVCKAFMSFK